MTIWRPRNSIRVIAIGLHWRDGRLLAADVLDDAGRVKGVRPLGGGVEFGESWQAAIVREFAEELGLAVRVAGGPLVLENIYCHEGTTGHEVVFVADVDFPDGAFDGQDSIAFTEDNGLACTARWRDLDSLDLPGGPALFPTGLKALLSNRRRQG